MGFNQNNEAMKDVRVRQAIAYALNKEELVSFAYLSDEFADPAYSILTPDTMYYDDSLTQYNNDPAKAQQLSGRSRLHKPFSDASVYVHQQDDGKRGNLYPEQAGRSRNHRGVISA